MDIYAEVIWIVVTWRLCERIAAIAGRKEILFIDFLKLKIKILSNAWSFSHTPVRIS